MLSNRDRVLAQPFLGVLGPFTIASVSQSTREQNDRSARFGAETVRAFGVRRWIEIAPFSNRKVRGVTLKIPHL